MEYRRCFFIGHREASEEILPALTQAIEQHISEYGVTDFIVYKSLTICIVVNSL